MQKSDQIIYDLFGSTAAKLFETELENKLESIVTSEHAFAVCVMFILLKFHQKWIITG